MKILIFNQAFSPSVGGVERFIDILSSYLEQLGEDVTVITNTKSNSETDINHSYNVFRCPSKKSIKELIAGCDLVHLNSFDPYIYFYSLFKRKKIVFTYHDLSLICPKANKFKDNKPCRNSAGPIVCYNCLRRSEINGKIKKLLRPVVKSFLSVINDANIVTSDFQFTKFRLHNKQKIYLGVDTKTFNPLTVSPSESVTTILFAGRLIKEKGCDVLIRAVKICIENGLQTELQIIGPGPESGSLKNLVRDLGIEENVKFIQTKYDRELVEFIRRAQIVVVPSVWDEPFGTISIEAFACGVPVIASDVGGLGQVVKECGLVYKRRDYLELAQKIQYLIENAEARKSLSTKSRDIALSKYNSVKMGQSYFRLFNGLVNNKYNKNYFTHVVSKIFPFKFRRMIHVSMVNRGWPVRVKEGNEGINKTGHRGYVGLAESFDAAGKLFFSCIKAMGLSPSDILCDIGCGSLKVGKHLIDYLDKGSYLGLDKEEKLIELGINNELTKACLEEKSPQFLVSSCFEFNKLSKIPTVALAISLFSHLNRKDIVLCLSNLADFVHSGGGTCKFYATFFETDKPVANYKDSHSQLGFYYTKQDMEGFGKESGWKWEYQDGWDTPSGQKFIKFSID